MSGKGVETVPGRTTDGVDPERPGLPEDGRRERLRAELMALREGLDVPDTDGATMAERVLAQILAEAVPKPVRGPTGGMERARAWWPGRKGCARSSGRSL